MKKQHIVEGIRQDIMGRIEHTSTNFKRKFASTLYHELGHMREGLAFGYIVSSVRVQRWFIVPDNEGDFAVYDIEVLALKDRRIRRLYKKAKRESKGECYMHKDATISIEHMADDFYDILAGGAEGTADLAQAVHIQKKPQWVQKLLMWNYHRHNPIKEQHPKRYAKKVSRKGNNDQTRMEHILESPWAAVELNAKFKQIAMGKECLNASYADSLHAAIQRHIKTPSH